MNRYVVGFLFDDDGSRVVLIEKQRPEWQRGKLNGVGGHVEEGETPLGAMVREFQEETGVLYHNWRLFVVLHGSEKLYIKTADSFEIHFYCAFNTPALEAVRQTTDENPHRCPVALLCVMEILPNLSWLIPMALSFRRGECADHFLIEEQENDYERTAPL